MLKRFLADASAATSIEYGLIAMIISVAIVAAAMGLGEEVRESFRNTAEKIEEARTHE